MFRNNMLYWVFSEALLLQRDEAFLRKMSKSWTREMVC